MINMLIDVIESSVIFVVVGIAAILTWVSASVIIYYLGMIVHALLKGLIV